MTTKPKRGAAKLKPCPFCGTVPQRIHDEESDTNKIMCVDDTCRMKPETDWLVNDYDMTIWNTRARRKKQRKGEKHG